MDRRPHPIRMTNARQESDGEPATVRPPFDPEEFARETERTTMPVPDEIPSEAPELVRGTMEVFWPVEATTIPELVVAREDLEWFELPPTTRRLLDLVDGATPVEAICARSGISLPEATNLFDDLARDGIIATR